MRVDEVRTGPLTAYRLWRILPFQDLEGPPSVRLCAAGTFGTPKFWPARAPVVAVCSHFKSRHAAPWPSHECGVWALPSLEDAEARVEKFAETTNFEGAYGWAVGAVALWGRVIEHENGYRAQYAYPGALTVTSRREHTARALADAYGIPVAWVRRRRFRVPVTEDEVDEDDPVKVLNESRRLLRKTESLLGKPEPPSRVDYAALNREKAARERAAFAKLEPVVLAPPGLDRDEVLVAFAMSAAEAWNMMACPTAVAEHLLERRGHEGPFIAYRDAVIARRGFLSVRVKAIRAMEAAAEEGMLEAGRQGYTKERHWYLTARGIRHVESLFAALPLITVTRRKFVPGGARYMAVDVKGHVSDLTPRDPVRTPFTHELEADRALWTQERKRAARQGRAAYLAWLADRRALPFAGNKIAFSDDEVVRVLRRVCRRGPVNFATFVQALAPGRALASERSVLSYQLGRLARAGDVARVKKGNRGPNLWTVAA